ncbi:MAG: hypothetical protein M5U28_26995 [Sandaracinaceae bacterium]|nr:hypothetical protein [Sandaracinaceae bacterium]
MDAVDRAELAARRHDAARGRAPRPLGARSDPRLAAPRAGRPDRRAPLPILLTGTRLAFPLGPAGGLGALLAVARRLRALPPGVGLRPVVHVGVRGDVQDARIRTILERRPRGLLRLDLVVVEAERAAGYERGVRLLVLTRGGSAAERAAGERLADLPAITSPGGRRVARVARLEELERIALAFADCPEAADVSRGTSAPDETLHALPPPRVVGF